ncbi:hypothetical protein AB0892_13030 [Streptomyces sp. NPDC005409]|uniref:hypothetical protein n=1 Tax=Streptomyces sp. NPDC005409 TaxID=3155342 RepID=UPI003455F331
MTRDRARKQEIRARMAQTGEPYSEARRQLTVEITAYCQQCGKEIAPDEGKLSLSRGEHERARAAREAFERERQERVAAAEPNDFQARILNPRDVPPRAQWVVFHYRCRPAEHWDGYGFEVGRMRTYRELMGVIIHLADKGYFEHTDLRTVLAEMHYTEPWGADEQKRRFRSVRPVEL